MKLKFIEPFLIECEVISDKKLYLESKVNVKFREIIPFQKNENYLSYDLISHGLNTMLSPYNENVQEIKNMVIATETTNTFLS